MDNSHSHEHVNDHSHNGHDAHAHSDHHADHGHADHAEHGDAAHAEEHDVHEAEGSHGARDKLVATAVTVGVVGVAAVVFEAALIPGMVLGVAAALAPGYVPRLGAALNPLFRSTIRSAYKLGRKTKEAASEVREQMSDIAAEVHAEGNAALDKAKAATA